MENILLGVIAAQNLYQMGDFRGACDILRECLTMSMEIHDVEFQLREVYKTQGKIPAIKLIRDKTNCGLREAKEAIENLFPTNGSVEESLRRCREEVERLQEVERGNQMLAQRRDELLKENDKLSDRLQNLEMGSHEQIQKLRNQLQILGIRPIV